MSDSDSSLYPCIQVFAARAATRRAGQGLRPHAPGLSEWVLQSDAMDDDVSDPKTLDEYRQLSGESPASMQGEILYAMHEISRLTVLWFDQAMVAHDITHAQWWAMMHIAQNEGLSQSDLARVMRMGRAAAGKLLDRLEARGWIERRPDPQDQRLRRVYLRDGALEWLIPARQAGLQQFQTFMDGIPKDIQDAMLTGLRAIKANALASITGETD